VPYEFDFGESEFALVWVKGDAETSEPLENFDKASQEFFLGLCVDEYII
jgi:hypothetical protein